MNVREITPEERRRTTELFGIAFEMAVGKETPSDPLPETVHLWASFADDAEMASCMTVSDMPVNFDGHVCQMTGIGGVSTLPQYRRQGGIRSIFQTILPRMYRDGFDFSYLYPFSTAYYRQFGYESCVQKLEATIKLSLLKVPALAGYFRLAEARCPMAEALQQLDQIWEKKYNLMVQHPDSAYDWVRQSDPAVKQEFTYVWFNANNQPRAYLTYTKADQPTGRNIVCSRFRFADRDGFQGLMSLFQSVSADHDWATFQLPACSGMQYLISEWALGRPSFSLIPWGMVRVTNAESVLRKARYIGSGSLTLRLEDAIIAQNNGTFTVTFRDGAAVSVEQTNQEPDAVLNIAAFSALIVGTSDFSEAQQWFTGLEVRNPNACFNQVFYRKPHMIVDFF